MPSLLRPLPITAALLAPTIANAVVIVGNPHDVEAASIQMPGADHANVLLDVTYEPCDGPSTVDSDVSADLVEGFTFDPPSGELCRIVVDLNDDVVITGTNASGEFEVVVAAGEFDVTDDDLPLTLAYTVVSGSVGSAPELHVD